MHVGVTRVGGICGGEEKYKLKCAIANECHAGDKLRSSTRVTRLND